MTWVGWVLVASACVQAVIFVLDVRSRAYHQGWKDGFNKASDIKRGAR